MRATSSSDTIGIGRDYKDATGHGTFVVETHNLYENELLVGERVRVASQILGADDKRLHVAHQMFRLADDRRSATQELMFLSIDLGQRRWSVPFLTAARAPVDCGCGSPCRAQAAGLGLAAASRCRPGEAETRSGD